MRWVEALKKWNSEKGGAWCVPKKGSAEHAAVMKIMKGEAEAPKKVRPVLMSKVREEKEKATVEKVKTTMKKEKIREFLKKALAKRKEKAAAEEKKKAEEAKPAESKTVIPSGKKNALTVSGSRLKEILTQNNIRFSRFDYPDRDMFMVYRTPKRIAIVEVPSDFEREMNRLEKRLGEDIRAALD